MRAWTWPSAAAAHPLLGEVGDGRVPQLVQGPSGGCSGEDFRRPAVTQSSPARAAPAGASVGPGSLQLCLPPGSSLSARCLPAAARAGEQWMRRCRARRRNQATTLAGQQRRREPLAAHAAKRARAARSRQQDRNRVRAQRPAPGSPAELTRYLYAATVSARQPSRTAPCSAVADRRVDARHHVRGPATRAAAAAREMRRAWQRQPTLVQRWRGGSPPRRGGAPPASASGPPDS